MIIDIVLHYLSGRGGTEEAIIKVAKGLTDRGHRVRVLMAFKSEHTEWLDSVKEFYYYALSLPWDASPSAFADKYKQLIEVIGKPDLSIPTLNPFLTYTCYNALNEDNSEHVPIISWLHMPIDRLGKRELLSYADAHLAISKSIMDDLNQNIDCNKIHLVGNPVTIKKDNVCKRPLDKLKLLYLGRLANYQKRLDILFYGLTKVKGDWSLQIVGDGPDAPMLHNLSKELGIDKNIEWLGWQEKPWEIIKEASVLVLTSDFEGFSISVLEALSRGIPIISTKCEGTVELIDNNINGWLIEKENPEQLADILNKIQQNNLELPTIKNCIASVKKFDNDYVIDKIEKILINEYNKNKNRKIIDMVLFTVDGNGEEEKLLLNVYKGLTKRGHRVRVFQLWAPKHQEWENDICERYYYGLNTKENAAIEVYSISYEKYVNDIGEPDIIITPFSPHLSYLCNYAVKNSTKTKIPIISLITSPIDSCNGRWSINYADAHLAINEYFKDDLSKSIDKEKIHLVNIPVRINAEKYIEFVDTFDDDCVINSIEKVLLDEYKKYNNHM